MKMGADWIRWIKTYYHSYYGSGLQHKGYLNLIQVGDDLKYWRKIIITLF